MTSQTIITWIDNSQPKTDKSRNLFLYLLIGLVFIGIYFFSTAGALSTKALNHFLMFGIILIYASAAGLLKYYSEKNKSIRKQDCSLQIKNNGLFFTNSNGIKNLVFYHKILEISVAEDSVEFKIEATPIQTISIPFPAITKAGLSKENFLQSLKNKLPPMGEIKKPTPFPLFILKLSLIIFASFLLFLLGIYLLTVFFP